MQHYISQKYGFRCVVVYRSTLTEGEYNNNNNNNTNNSTQLR